jgi:hypothetical protein
VRARMIHVTEGAADVLWHKGKVRGEPGA